MPVSAQTLKKLMDAGLAGDDLLDVVASIDADNASKSRSSGAERQARYRARKIVTSDVTGDVTESDASPISLDKEPPHTPQEINPPSPPISPRRDRFADPAVGLQSVTDPLTARAFADHCAQRKPRLTEQSAGGVVTMLRDGATKGYTPTKVLRFAMDRGWGVGFGLDWCINAGLKPDAVPTVAIDWAARVKALQSEDLWHPSWGPKPGEPGCLVPPEILATAA